MECIILEAAVLSGNEIYGPEDVGLQTNISLPHVPLNPGIKYYTTVYAFNMLDMSSFDTSGGFMVDRDAPTIGSVYTHVSSEIVVVSWVGFSDMGSYVLDYMYSITLAEDKPCFVSTGFLTSITEQVSYFKHGEKYVASVKAIDAAGHESAIASSKEFTIDLTSPQLKKCQLSEEIYKEPLVCKCEPMATLSPDDICRCVANETFGTISGYLYKVVLRTQDTLPQDLGRLEVGSHTDWVRFGHIENNMFEYETYFVSIEKEHILPLLRTKTASENYTVEAFKCNDIQPNNIESIEIKQLGSLGIHIIHPFYDPESSVKNIQVGVGTTKNGFQLYPLQVTGKETTTYLELALQHNIRVYATVIATNNVGAQTVVNANPITIDWTPPTIENVTSVVTGVGSDLYVIEATWNAVDNETLLTECFWTIGEEMPLMYMCLYLIYVCLTDVSKINIIIYVHLSALSRIMLYVYIIFKTTLSRPVKKIENVMELIKRFSHV